jgi:hypothetical protein
MAVQHRLALGVELVAPRIAEGSREKEKRAKTKGNSLSAAVLRHYAK